MYEYKLVHLPAPKIEARTLRLNEEAHGGWEIMQANVDLTLFLYRRECVSVAPPDVMTSTAYAPTPEHIRITDSFPVLNIDMPTEPTIEPSFLRYMDIDDALARERQTIEVSHDLSTRTA